MSDRDLELEKMLEPLKGVNATDAQVKRWKMALREELAKTRVSSRRLPIKWLAATAASLVIGIFIGNYNATQKSKNIVDDETNATIEYISVKSL